LRVTKPLLRKKGGEEPYRSSIRRKKGKTNLKEVRQPSSRGGPMKGNRLFESREEMPSGQQGEKGKQK